MSIESLESSFPNLEPITLVWNGCEISIDKFFFLEQENAQNSFFHMTKQWTCREIELWHRKQGSKILQIPGASSFPAHLGIGGTNGIRNSPEQAQVHAERLSKIAGDCNIDWVYNSTYSFLIDIGEAIFFNYQGYSTAAIYLREKWEQFHKNNEQNPAAKYLQFCHSQGAIHVKNALLGAPPEIRNRIITIAIAPAAIIPKSLCYDAYNYASQRDLVFFGEFTADLLINPIKAVQDFEDLKELILLEPHPDAPQFDHSFDSPTFAPIIERHIAAYLNGKDDFIRTR